MVRKIKALKTMIAGLFILLIGLILIICTIPVFTHTHQELEQIPRSEVITDSTFDIHQLEDREIEFQISIGQSLYIYVECNGNISFSIANFTQINGVVQSDQPDIIYFSQNDTATINTTWKPQSRLPYPGKYYLVFLARNASSGSPVHVYANVIKTWIDYRFVDVQAEDRISLLNHNFVYLGLMMIVLGAVLFSIALYRSRKSGNRG